MTHSYDLHISLMGIQPPIWRLVRVPGCLTLNQLHHVFNTAMGWTNSHLHEFQIGGKNYTDPETVSETATENLCQSERGVKLGQLNLKLWEQFTYIYDYGDNWTHEIVVRDIQPRLPDDMTVRLLDGARACPPEDCCGAGGYEMMLKALLDPKHPEHESFLQWIGKSYDPDAFPRQEFEQALHRIWLGKQDT